MAAPVLDLATIGRSSVHLYGQQIGGRLEDMGTFVKAVGGCPTNIAIGTARLGLASAAITRVGDEHMGRFVREQLAREGVDITGVHTDPERLTALVILGVRDENTFPLIFYRSDCADAALDESDIDEDFVASAGALVVTGTHFASAHSAAAQKKAMAIARRHGRKVVFDVDYRPNLWVSLVTARARSATSAPIRSARICRRFCPAATLSSARRRSCTSPAARRIRSPAIRRIRELTQATIVCKRGPMGCVVFEGDVPGSLHDGIKGRASPSRSITSWGAGAHFMSGFLRGWLKREPLETCCTYANACGAIAVSRLLCSPESPTFAELQFFLKHGSPHRALRRDEALNHIHWATTRRPQPERLMALAIDHRAQFEEMADKAGVSRDRNCALQGTGGAGGGACRAGAPRLWHVAGRRLRPGGPGSRRRSWLLDRETRRKAGLPSARFRDRGRRLRRRSSRRMACDAHREGAGVIAAGRSSRHEASAGA
jgi:5-dehydro-2-deoxygluconokinase